MPGFGRRWGQHSELHDDFHGVSQAHDELKRKLEEAKRASAGARAASREAVAMVAGRMVDGQAIVAVDSCDCAPGRRETLPDGR